MSAKTIMARIRMTKTQLTATLLSVCMLFLLTSCVLYPLSPPIPEPSPFRQKSDLLWEQVEANWDKDNRFPAEKVGNVVFFSVSDGASRADVCHGKGKSLQSAWKEAVRETEAFLRKNPKDIIWVKADIVSSSELVSIKQLSKRLLQSNCQQFYQGLSFDDSFDIALIEAELNGTVIYDYYNGAANMPNLNNYLASAGRDLLENYPENLIAFQCRSWFCDENNEVFELITEGENFGRRSVENLDAGYVQGMITTAAEYLTHQVQEDGAFIYHYYPRFGEIPRDYNIIRHAGTIWSMVQAYQISPNEELAGSIQRAINYMISQIVYDENGRAFLYDEADDEIALGGNALAALALTEYTEVFQDSEYLDLCVALGEGMLSMQDPSTGEYFHILSKDFAPLEAYRTIYYDGEATFALCRLYGLTEDSRFLEATKRAAGNFIATDYTQYHDHWVAYSMNELTKYVTDQPEYLAFAMKNITENLDYIEGLYQTSPTVFEMLMAGFETYSRAPDPSILSHEELGRFIEAIHARSQWMLNGYFYPEYAMYMKNPQYILGTFMTRTDGFRVRIDDVQHNIGGCFLYQKNYDRLTEEGLLSAV